nr:hypothetical protein [Streptomyces asoensis]
MTGLCTRVLREINTVAVPLGGDSAHGPGIGVDGAGARVVWQASY